MKRDNTGHRNRLWSDDEESEIVNLYNNGTKLEGLALRYNGSSSGILNILYRHNIPIREHNRICGIRCRYTDKVGRTFILRSRWEALAAYHLDKCVNHWDYEVCSYAIPILTRAGKPRTYTPDFWIYDNAGNLIKVIDVKGRISLSQHTRIDAFTRAYPNIQLEMWKEGDLRSFGFTNKDLTNPKILLGNQFDELVYSST